MKHKLILLFFLLSQILFAQILAPGDGVRITFYNTPDDISGDYFVQPDGMIQLPFIGVFEVMADSVDNVMGEIESRYNEFYKDPELTIQPLYRINVLGEVRNPGYYYATGFENITDIIAAAGGETSDAALSDTRIIRNSEEIEIDVDEIVNEGNAKTNFDLRSGDKIFVPRRWWVAGRNTAVIVSGVAALATIVVLLFANN